MKALSTLAFPLLALSLAACSADYVDGTDSSASQQNAAASRPYSAPSGGDVLEDETGGALGQVPGTKQGENQPVITDDNAPSEPMGTTSVDDGDVFAFSTIIRALKWVEVGMPYCGGSNHGTDYICGGTCVRTGKDASPEWDPYRTDCSGFVSWSWGLPPPGRTTTNLAPFNTDITTVIAVDDLLPGDALNNKQHIVLFGGWMNAQKTKARILEEYNCGQVAVDRVRDVSKVSANVLRLPSGNFTAIRLDARKTAK